MIWAIWPFYNLYCFFYTSYYYFVIEEENYGRNADLITKHFIAEGVVCDHSILIVDVEKKPEIIVNISLIIYYVF